MLDGCGCGALLLERAGAPVLLLCCSLSAGENERMCVCVWEGQSHTRTREGVRLFPTSSCFLPTFHAGGYGRSIRCTVVHALLLFHQHGQQTRAETQAEFITTKNRDFNPRPGRGIKTAFCSRKPFRSGTDAGKRSTDLSSAAVRSTNWSWLRLWDGRKNRRSSERMGEARWPCCSR